jgi:EAL domain-containing protein (putative c-di-GMP-specific phosphodiesterase class I)
LACGFVEFVQAALARHPDVLPSLLEIEILETVALSDMAAAIRTVQACTDIGVSFALDDFGTGYSSLTYLRKLPVQTLKIDQSFVRDMLADPDDLRIVQGVIELAAVFGRQVIAEGVETLEHGAVLRHLGCRLAQGYGVARPMPASDVALWAKDWAQRRAWESLKLPLDFSQRWPELAAPALAGA